MTLPRPAVVAALLAAGVLALTACSGGTVTTGSAPTSSAPAGSTAPTSAAPTSAAPTSSGPGSGVAVPGVPGFPTDLVPTLFTSPPGGAAGSALPADFPVPPGASVLGGADAGNEIAAQLRVASATSAFDFYLTALPAAGYTVVSSDRGALPAAGEIRVAGHGFGGNSQLAFSGSTVTVQLDRT